MWSGVPAKRWEVVTRSKLPSSMPSRPTVGPPSALGQLDTVSSFIPEAFQSSVRGPKDPFRLFISMRDLVSDLLGSVCVLLSKHDSSAAVNVNILNILTMS